MFSIISSLLYPYPVDFRLGHMTCLDNEMLAVMLGTKAWCVSVRLGLPPYVSAFLLEKSKFQIAVGPKRMIEMWNRPGFNI